MLLSMRWILLIASFSQGIIFCNALNSEPAKFAIVGLGGRAQWLLLECLKLKENIRVVAICDDNAQRCIDNHSNKLITQKNHNLLKAYQAAIADVTLYSNTPKDLRELFEKHTDLDTVFITSPNYDHFSHLNRALEANVAKKIFMEKPLFRTLQEFNKFDFHKAENKTVFIGLTLRYSSMAHIVEQQLQMHKDNLGMLKEIKIWERLSFKHALPSFIMSGWRRYISRSGGFMLEKVIHDLDLALFFTDVLKIDFDQMNISTQAANKFFIKSRKNELLNYMMNDDGLLKRIAFNDKSWQPFNFIRDESNNIVWEKTLDNLLSEYPDDDTFTGTDLIPDYQKLTAKIITKQKNIINLELEVDMAEFRFTTERGQRFIFENGDVLIDIMASKMHTRFNNGQIHECDLRTNNTDHADGDEYIIDTIIGKPLPEGYHMATLNDPIVKLANLMVLISEDQAHCNLNKNTHIEKKDRTWSITA